MQTLLDYDWPGNVRQLENTIERAAVLAQGGLIGPSHLVLSESTGAQEQLLTDALERLLDKGRGLEGVARKAADYYNPATEILEKP